MICRLAVLAAAALAAGACSAGGGGDAITVLAASSLTDVFEEMIAAFEETDGARGVEVGLVLGGSSALATQLEEGAPGDVVATASPSTMERVVRAGRVRGEPVVFARNSLVIAVERSNPRGIDGLDDLRADGLLVARCAPQVPCGALADELLAAAGVDLQPASLEPNVRSVLTKVSLGEVDAGLVYRTDVTSAPVDAVEPPGARAFTTAYQIARLGDDPAAAAFVDFVLSAEGQAILAAAGFTVEP